MSANTYIKQAVIAALCEHPAQEKYRARAFAGDSLKALTEALSGASVVITKQDFFTPDEDGNILIDTAGFWRNLDKIEAMLAARGERFDTDDYLQPIGGGYPRRTLLTSAAQHGALDKIFNQKNWRGRFDEMECLWFKLPYPARRENGTDGTVPLPLKRALLSAEGKTAPEDRLSRAGLTPNDIQAAFRERGNFEALLQRLGNAGDYLRKEYLLLVDHNGSTCFADNNAWNRYPQVAAQLAAHGERLTVADFIRQVGTASNILTRAAEAKALDRVFAPELWEGRLKEMLELWSHMREAWKVPPMTMNDFDLVYADAESRTYAPVLHNGGWNKKADLLSPLNDAGKPVLGLGLKQFWEQAGDVLPVLASAGQAVTLADLRRPSGETGHSCMMHAVKFGQFKHVAGIARAGQDELSLDDFLAKDRHGNTMLSILAARKELPLVFVPELWAGRVNDMKTLWSQVRPNDRSQVDMAKVEIATKQATLKKQNKSAFKIKRG